MGLGLMGNEAPLRSADVPVPARARSLGPGPVSVVAVTVVALMAMAWWVARSVTSLQVLADEPGVWAVGLFLGQGPERVVMAGAPPYSIATGAVLAPLTRLVRPSAWYEAGILLMGVVTLLSGLVVARSGYLGATRPLGRMLAAATVVLLPASVLGATFTWAEPASLLYFTVWCAAASWAIRRGDLVSLSAAAVLAGSSRLVHGRFTLVPLVWIGLVVLVEYLRRDPDLRRRAVRVGTVVLVTAAAVVLQSVAQRVVITHVWQGRPDAGDRLDLRGASAVYLAMTFVRCLVGQIWYLGASTAGLAWVGAGVLLRSARRSVHPGERPDGGDLDLGPLVVLGSVAAVVLTSVLFMTEAIATTKVPYFMRFDHLVYGRYIAPCAAVLAAVGVVAVFERFPTRSSARQAGAVVGGLLFGGVLVALLTSTQKMAAVFPSVLPGLSALPSLGLGRDGFSPLGWSLVAAVLAGLLYVARRWRPSAFALLLMVVLVAGGTSAARLSVQQHRTNDYSALYAPFGSPEPGRQRVLVAQDAASSESYRWGVYGQQFEMAPKGWKFELRKEGSADLAAAVPPDAGLVVLRQGTDVPGWIPSVTFGDVVLWTPPRTG
jgi:hypothetical protein